jgi:hypothetical protein
MQKLKKKNKKKNQYNLRHQIEEKLNYRKI